MGCHRSLLAVCVLHRPSSTRVSSARHDERDVAVRTLSVSRDAASTFAAQVARGEGPNTGADALHSIRHRHPRTERQLPIGDYDDLNVAQAASVIKELTEPDDFLVIVLYEQTTKDRHGVVSAAHRKHIARQQYYVRCGR